MKETKQTTPGLSSQEIETKFDRVDELVSLLVDEAIEEPQVRELEKLLQDEPLRGRYIDNIQLHCDLLEYFKKGKTEEELKSPVLGFLGESDGSGVDMPIPKTPKQK